MHIWVPHVCLCPKGSEEVVRVEKFEFGMNVHNEQGETSTLNC